MGSYKNLNHMKYIQALLFASAFAAVNYDDDNVTIVGNQSIDGDNLKFDMTVTSKGTFDATLGFAAAYGLTNWSGAEGKTIEESMKMLSDNTEQFGDDWMTFAFAELT